MIEARERILDLYHRNLHSFLVTGDLVSLIARLEHVEMESAAECSTKVQALMRQYSSLDRNYDGHGKQ